MAQAFIDEALARLIENNLVVRNEGRLSFSEEWIDFLLTNVSYTMDSETIKKKIRESLKEFYIKKGYSGDLRFDLAWIKQIFLAQFADLSQEEKEIIQNFVDAVNTLE